MRGRGFKRTVLSVATALLLPLTIAGIEAPPATAALNLSGFDFWVDSATMGPIKTRIFRAADGNTDRVVYVLDGERAQQDLNGWEINTNVAEVLQSWNINVVMPIGGESSFYADWDQPSSWFGIPPGAGSSATNTGSGVTEALGAGPGKSYRYTWETFLTNDLRWAMRDRLGFNPYRNGVFGLSMGGSAALTLAAYHPDEYSFAGSFSGYLNISAPGMREAIRVAMIDAGGYNVDCMAPPWGPNWLRMDPFVFAPTLIGNGTRVWVSAGSGAPMPEDLSIPIGDAADRLIRGAPLEALALANSRAFQVRMLSLGAQNVVWDFPSDGLHAWTNWQADAYRMIPDLSANIG
ncbi:alpha/beta hydrolase [Nocardia sp. NPDC088792]|uniref:alpha/beta hydrolase n=1 Tax=Nocardia sp. NPDC088792 TaxID=3364332 RepID=UPI003804B88E